MKNNMKKLFIVFIVLMLPCAVFAKGSSGGGRSSSSGSRSSSSSSPSSKSSSTSNPSKSTPTTPKVSAKPSTSTKTIDTPSKTTSTGKKTTGKANVVDDNYKPSFKGGYIPPTGSTVQYVERSSSFIDYLPWVYIFSQDSRERVNTQEAVVTEPNGEEKTVEQFNQEGSDEMLVFNWILMIVIGSLGIWGIMWVVSNYTK